MGTTVNKSDLKLSQNDLRALFCAWMVSSRCAFGLQYSSTNHKHSLTAD